MTDTDRDRQTDRDIYRDRYRDRAEQREAKRDRQTHRDRLGKAARETCYIPLQHSPYYSKNCCLSVETGIVTPIVNKNTKLIHTAAHSQAVTLMVPGYGLSSSLTRGGGGAFEGILLIEKEK